MTTQKYVNSQTESGSAKIKNYTIISNGGEQLKIGRGFNSLSYYESIFDTTIRVESKIVDATGPTGIGKNIIDRLQLTAGEQIKISLEDGYKNQLSVNLILKNHSYVQNVKGVVVDLNMWSKESVDNEDTKKRVIKKYIELISDSVSDILKNTLGTSLNLDIDTSLGEFVFTGNKATATPFDQCLWLASRCVPDFSGSKGKLAGYLFFQTSEGFKFKSIDKLFSESAKLKFIYNDKIEEKLPPGYDAKILDYEFNTSMDIEQMMRGGVFSRSESVTLNPYKSEYIEDDPFDQNSQNMRKNNAGKQVPIIGQSLNFSQRSFKINTRTLDTGQLKPLTKKDSKEINLIPQEILRQARARYNQLATSNLTITIPLNFKLHAGDMVEVDFPEPKGGEGRSTISKRKSGRYMIESLSHNISLVSVNFTPNITTLSLVRDTEGK
jgi:hypothetical protein